MLILTRKPGESLYIGDEVVVTVVEIKGNQVRVGIKAPADRRIYREEIYMQILEENKKAAEGDISGSVLDQLSGWQGSSREASAAGPRTSKITAASPKSRSQGKETQDSGVGPGKGRGTPHHEGGKE